MMARDPSPEEVAPAAAPSRLALDYAARGWAVFPLRGKVPLVSKEDGGRGVHDATTDPEKIAAWWKAHPGANIGVATGRPSGFWVVDVDPGKGGLEAGSSGTGAGGSMTSSARW